MTLEILGNLNFLLDIIKSIFTDSLKNYLGKNKSINYAKRHSFALYQQLEQLTLLTNEYVSNLDNLVYNISTSKDNEKIIDLKFTLSITVHNLSSTLMLIKGILHKLSPQIDIHLPEIVHSLTTYSHLRGFSIDKVNRCLEIDSFMEQDMAHLQEILETAKNNREIIISSLSYFRGFLANEFPFKESF